MHQPTKKGIDFDSQNKINDNAKESLKRNI